MQHSEGKMKFLAVKLAALQSELKISKEIFQSAAKEVDLMFHKKYYPELPAQKPKEPAQVPVEKSPDERPSQQEEQPGASANKESAKFVQEEEDRTESTKTLMTPQVKSIFKKIALKIHPDRLIGLADGYEKRKKEQMYLRATTAAENNDLLILVDIAMELEIEPPEISEDQLKLTEEKINAIKKEINHIESTVVWKWFFCADKDHKERILEKLFELMYEKNSRT